jgi:hypothetical protein
MILNPRYIVTIRKFNLIKQDHFVGEFQYKSIGVIAEFNAIRKDTTWQLKKMEVSQY